MLYGFRHFRLLIARGKYSELQHRAEDSDMVATSLTDSDTPPIFETEVTILAIMPNAA